MNNTDLSSLIANARKSLIADQHMVAQNAALSYEFGHRYEARTADAVEKLNENQTL